MEIWNLEITYGFYKEKFISKISYRVLYKKDNKQSYPTIVYKKSWYGNHEYKIKQVSKITCF